MKVLIVEEKILPAFFLNDLLVELGHEVVGPAHSPSDVVAFLSRNRPDCVLLNRYMHGSPCEPIAVFLRQQKIPFIWLTETALTDFRAVGILQKPVSKGDLENALTWFGQPMPSVARSGFPGAGAVGSPP
jgi:two-component SAPR family response regulator